MSSATHITGKYDDHYATKRTSIGIFFYGSFLFNTCLRALKGHLKIGSYFVRMFVRMLKTKYVRFAEQMVWLLEYFFQHVRNLYSLLSITENFFLHIQLKRISKQQVGGLSPVSLSSLEKHLNISWCRNLACVPPSTANHWLNIDSLALQWVFSTV